MAFDCALNVALSQRGVFEAVPLESVDGVYLAISRTEKAHESKVTAFGGHSEDFFEQVVRARKAPFFQHHQRLLPNCLHRQ